MSKISRQQRFLIVAAVILIAYATDYLASNNTPQLSVLSSAEVAFEQQHSDVQIEVTGTIIKLLPDDNEGTRHQKFILKTNSGLTLLVAHNVDLASRIENIQLGENITLYGEYEWSQQGGVMHWTHHDPNGRHIGGWIDYQGRRYQ